MVCFATLFIRVGIGARFGKSTFGLRFIILPSAFNPSRLCAAFTISPLTTYAVILPLWLLSPKFCFVFSDNPAALKVMALSPVLKEFALANPPPNE